MTKIEKVKSKVFSGEADANIQFKELVTLIESLGFARRRVKGSHHIFSRPDTPESIHIQPRGKMAKDYQVKQVRDLLLRYGL